MRFTPMAQAMGRLMTNRSHREVAGCRRDLEGFDHREDIGGGGAKTQEAEAREEQLGRDKHHRDDDQDDDQGHDSISRTLARLPSI